MHPDIAQVLYTESQIAQCIANMGAQITTDYAQRVSPENSLIAICTLRGAALFMADLIRKIDLPLQTEYIFAASYGNAAKSSGLVDVQETFSCDLEGRHVIVVEDMLDSGLTLQVLLDGVAAHNPASLETAVFMKKLRKDGANSAMNAKYVGFECPDEFMVGYGLDYAQCYRNLPYVGVLKSEIYE